MFWHLSDETGNAGMKFSTKQDIEAPLVFVHQTLTDFDMWERAAMRRGAEIGRTDTLRQPGPGMAWTAKFSYRGKDRSIAVTLTEWDAPVHLAFAGHANTIEAQARIELLEMSAKRTRLLVTMDVTPNTLGARLFLQSLRLARARVDRSFDQRVAQIAGDIEQRFRGQRRA